MAAESVPTETVIEDDEWGELVATVEPQRSPNRKERRDAVRQAKKGLAGIGRACGFGAWRS